MDKFEALDQAIFYRSLQCTRSQSAYTKFVAAFTAVASAPDFDDWDAAWNLLLVSAARLDERGHPSNLHTDKDKANAPISYRQALGLATESAGRVCPELAILDRLQLKIVSQHESYDTRLIFSRAIRPYANALAGAVRNPNIRALAKSIAAFFNIAHKVWLAKKRSLRKKIVRILRRITTGSPALTNALTKTLTACSAIDLLATVLRRKLDPDVVFTGSLPVSVPIYFVRNSEIISVDSVPAAIDRLMKRNSNYASEILIHALPHIPFPAGSIASLFRNFQPSLESRDESKITLIYRIYNALPVSSPDIEVILHEIIERLAKLANAAVRNVYLKCGDIILTKIRAHTVAGNPHTVAANPHTAELLMNSIKKESRPDSLDILIKLHSEFCDPNSVTTAFDSWILNKEANFASIANGILRIHSRKGQVVDHIIAWMKSKANLLMDKPGLRTQLASLLTCLISISPGIDSEYFAKFRKTLFQGGSADPAVTNLLQIVLSIPELLAPQPKKLWESLRDLNKDLNTSIAIIVDYIMTFNFDFEKTEFKIAEAVATQIILCLIFRIDGERQHADLSKYRRLYGLLVDHSELCVIEKYSDFLILMGAHPAFSSKKRGPISTLKNLVRTGRVRRHTTDEASENIRSVFDKLLGLGNGQFCKFVYGYVGYLNQDHIYESYLLNAAQESWIPALSTSASGTMVLEGMKSLSATKLSILIPQLIPNLLTNMKDTRIAFVNFYLLDFLTSSFVPESVVPERSLIPRCLFASSHEERDSRLMAEKICSTIQADAKRPLFSEAAQLILPVILVFLIPSASPHSADVSLVGIHRASIILLNQLSLGARMSPVDVMKCVDAILKLMPNLASVALEILKRVPKLPDFNNNEDFELLSRFLVTNTPRVQKDVVKMVETVLPRVELVPQLVTLRVHILALGCKECIVTSSTRLPRNSFMDLAIGELDCEPVLYRNAVAKSLAVEFAEEDTAKLISCVVEAYTSKFVCEESEKSERTAIFSGFKLRDEDRKRLEASMKQETVKIKDVVFRSGRFGVLRCLANLAATSLPVDLRKLLVEFASNIAFQPHGQVDPLSVDLLMELSLDVFRQNGGTESELEDLLIRLQAVSEYKIDRIGAKASALVRMIGSCVTGCADNKALIERVNLAFEELLISSETPGLVKRSVSGSIPFVMDRMVSLGLREVEEVVSHYRSLALNQKNASSKAGGALGLAAFIKSQGISVIKEFAIIDGLVDTIKKDEFPSEASTSIKLGCYLCFEGIIEVLGRLVEPMALKILSVILVEGLSDGNEAIRRTSRVIARKLMDNMSPHAVRTLILPEIIRMATSDSVSWRTMLGAIELLSSSNQIGEVLPVFCENAHHANKEVKLASAKGLASLATGIPNPDLKSISKSLIDALVTSAEIPRFLSILSATVFHYYLDDTSVHFLLPILQRGIRLNSTRVQAAQITAVLPKITQPSVLNRHCAILIQSLLENLGSPLPEVRQSSSKALGLLCQELDENAPAVALPHLIKTLKGATSSVLRSGAANALVEVFYALGTDVLKQYLPDLLKQIETSAAGSDVREGFLGIFVYMPLVFKNDFEDFVPQVLPVLLSNLAANEENIRNIAHRACQIFVNQYGSSHTPLLLQPLEKALFHQSMQVRLKALSLLGLLIEKILKGVEISDTEGGQRMQLEILSLERRAYILSAIYLSRSDEEPEVRHSSAAVWKSVVQNTPKTVHEILPILTKRLIDMLNSEDEIRQMVASRCVEELALKHGERLLPEIMSMVFTTRQKNMKGVFLGLQAILNSTNPAAFIRAHAQLIPLIQKEFQTCSDNELRRNIVEVVAMLVKADELQAFSKSGTFLKKFLAPVLDEYFTPPVFGSELDNSRMNVNKSLELLMESVGLQSFGDVLKRCGQSPVDLSKILLVGSMSQCRMESIRLSWNTMIAILIQASDENLRSPIKSALLRLIRSFSVEVIDTDVFPMIEELMKGSNEPQFACSATSWQSLALRYSETVAQLNALNAENMLSIIEANDLSIEPTSKTSTKFKRRGFACLMAGALIDGTNVDFDSKGLSKSDFTKLLIENAAYLGQLILPLALSELDPDVSVIASSTFEAFVKSLDRETSTSLCPMVRDVLIRLVADPFKCTLLEPKVILPGASNKTVFENVISILHAGLLYGPMPSRVDAAEAIRWLILSTSEKTLPLVAVKATGPLIRVFAERVQPKAKEETLATLIYMLQNTGTSLKALVPQFQSTFLRCITNSSSETELKDLAGTALGLLAKLAGPRNDLLIRELAKTLNIPDEEDNRPSTLKAICHVSKVAIHEVQEPTRELLIAALKIIIEENADELSVSMAKKTIETLLKCDSDYFSPHFTGAY